jgi:DNA-binding CsgD family transcriptional regulator
MLLASHRMVPLFSRTTRPCALAGHAWEAPVSAALALGVTVTFGLELLTPRDVVATLVLLPLLIAVWVLSTRWVVLVGGLAAVEFAIAVAAEGGNRPTLVITGVVGLCLLLVARGYAVSSFHSLQGGPTPTSTEASGLGPRATGASQSISGIGALSRRELEVARLASRGHTAPDIGRMLHIGERTVETHIAHTYAKLHIQSKRQLIRMCEELEQKQSLPPLH